MSKGNLFSTQFKVETRLPFYYDLVQLVSEQSTCRNDRHNGALLINPESGRVVSMGYNGSPSGLPHCENHGCMLVGDPPHCAGTIHAEMNAIANLDKMYKELTMICTSYPCLSCLKNLMAFRVKNIFYLNDWEGDDGRDIFMDYFQAKRIEDVTIDSGFIYRNIHYVGGTYISKLEKYSFTMEK